MAAACYVEALHYWTDLTAFVLVGFDLLVFRSNGNSFWWDSFWWDFFWWDFVLMGSSHWVHVWVQRV